MNFTVPLALFIALAAMGPILAHLLRRGRTQQVVFFSATRLVPTQKHLATQRRSTSEWLLLFVRVGLIIGLALLGASPLLRCDRAVLDRHQGASVARILLLDDSGSMQTLVSAHQSRFECARRSALALTEQMRDGDSLGIVLASKPARVLLAPSSDPKTVWAALTALQGTDRPTALEEAVSMARSLLARQPQKDQRILLFSDLASDGVPDAPDVERLLPELSKPWRDCALSSARRHQGRLTVAFVCTQPLPRLPLGLVVSDSPEAKPTESAQPFTPAPRGEVVLKDSGKSTGAEKAQWVRISGGDDNPANDVAPLIEERLGLVVGTYSDPALGKLATGGAPIVEQALRALDPTVEIRSLPTVPDDVNTLAPLSLLILDDPPPLSAESRLAISEFVRRGNSAVAMFGPATDTSQLGSLPAPFFERKVSWQADAPAGLDLSTLKAALFAASSLEHLDAQGRLLFDESQDPNARVMARWSDGRPFWLSRPFGRGNLSAFGLPSNVALSGFALRPAYLSTLQYLLEQQSRQGRSRVVVVGDAWRFYGDEKARVVGPYGTVNSASLDDGTAIIRPDRVGRYRVVLATGVEERIATWPETETVVPSKPWPTKGVAKTNPTTGQLDISYLVAFGLLGLLSAELLLRLASLTGSLRLSPLPLRTLRKSANRQMVE